MGLQLFKDWHCPPKLTVSTHKTKCLPEKSVVLRGGQADDLLSHNVFPDRPLHNRPTTTSNDEHSSSVTSVLSISLKTHGQLQSTSISITPHTSPSTYPLDVMTTNKVSTDANIVSIGTTRKSIVRSILRSPDHVDDEPIVWDAPLPSYLTNLPYRRQARGSKPADNRTLTLLRQSIYNKRTGQPVGRTVIRRTAIRQYVHSASGLNQ